MMFPIYFESSKVLFSLRNKKSKKVEGVAKIDLKKLYDTFSVA